MDQKIGNVCTRNVVTVTPATTVAEAAALMRKNHIGAVVIVEERAGARVPTGILTDRDIVIEVVAVGLDGKTIKVAEIVQRQLATVKSDATCSEVVREMSIQGVRRMPVVNPDGTLVGILTTTNCLEALIWFSKQVQLAGRK